MTAGPGRLPTVFIPHGGGPCFFMDWKMGPPDTWYRLAEFLQSFDDLIGRRPEAIVVISAHHEGRVVEIGDGARPSMLFDYYGFPEHTYELSYPAPGSSTVSHRIGQLLDAAGIAYRYDSDRGFDHGVFVPFLLMYPDADIPIVQVSLRSDLDPRFHLGMGAALAPLRDEGVLIVGSGMSYHNMSAFMRRGVNSDSRVFDEWLAEACAATPASREELLSRWERAPAARSAHPREEHLMPLMVVAGAARDDLGRRVFVDEVMGATISAQAFGDLAGGR
ncbi:MAG: DODA-type extradiol aromatic ring-opening family dioxygenase [Rhodococcus sp. (in: high G+C Gram-positive bacteria)]